MKELRNVFIFIILLIMAYFLFNGFGAFGYGGLHEVFDFGQGSSLLIGLIFLVLLALVIVFVRSRKK